jgi:light-regulated signal transduction histidine kinase (bacteriophytochrome)
MTFDDIALFSPLPIAQLRGRNQPRDGFLIKLPSSCHKNWPRNAQCEQHYERLSALPRGQFVQCPYGFTSFTNRAGQLKFALTGVIGYPRFQSEMERGVAKKHPEHRIDRAALESAASALGVLVKNVQEIETNTVRQHSMALHEIRKLNRQVKQTAERLCHRESPDEPDLASPDLVKILKTSELMSRQFDVIEILANEELTRLPLNSASELYKIFDKCARIYRTSQKRIVLDAPPSFSPRIDVCDKTFPIIPSVLIENALKYSSPESEVRIVFAPIDRDRVSVAVSNTSLPLAAPLTDVVFERGFRGTTDTDGSGNGLYVAQLVAKQHGTAIGVQSSDLGNRTRVTFQVPFRVK